MLKFFFWDHDGLLVDTERWYSAATKEDLRELGVLIDQTAYLDYMAGGRSRWDLSIECGEDRESVLRRFASRRDKLREHLFCWLFSVDVAISSAVGTAFE